MSSLYLSGRIRTVATTLALVLGLALHAGAAVALDQDEREIAAYTLSMDKVRALAAATTALNGLGQSTTDDEEEFDDEDYAGDDEEAGEDEDSDIESIADFVAEIEARPGAKAAIAAHGFAPREFAVATMAMLQASMVVALQGANTAAPLPPGVNAKNVALIRANQDEVNRLYRPTSR